MAKEDFFLCAEFVLIYPFHRASIPKSTKSSFSYQEWEQWYKTLLITEMESQWGQMAAASTCPRMEAWP